MNTVMLSIAFCFLILLVILTFASIARRLNLGKEYTISDTLNYLLLKRQKSKDDTVSSYWDKVTFKRETNAFGLFITVLNSKSMNLFSCDAEEYSTIAKFIDYRKRLHYYCDSLKMNSNRYVEYLQVSKIPQPATPT